MEGLGMTGDLTRQEAHLTAVAEHIEALAARQRTVFIRVQAGILAVAVILPLLTWALVHR
jgi:hypothetical protein